MCVYIHGQIFKCSYSMHMMYRSWVLILWLLPNYKLECTSKYNSQQFGCNTWMLMVDVISWYCQWWKTCGSTGYEVLTQTSTYPSFFYNSGITIHIAYTMYILLTVHLYFTTLSTTRLLVIWSYAAASAPQTPTPTPQGVRPQPHTVPDPSNPYVRIYIYIYTALRIYDLYITCILDYIALLGKNKKKLHLYHLHTTHLALSDIFHCQLSPLSIASCAGWPEVVVVRLTSNIWVKPCLMFFGQKSCFFMIQSQHS